MVSKSLMHRCGRERKEMMAVVHRADTAHNLHSSLIEKRGWMERVVGTFPAKHRARQAAEFPMDHLKQAIRIATLVVADVLE
jgi:hypothetical protein